MLIGNCVGNIHAGSDHDVNMPSPCGAAARWSMSPTHGKVPQNSWRQEERCQESDSQNRQRTEKITEQGFRGSASVRGVFAHRQPAPRRVADSRGTVHRFHSSASCQASRVELRKRLTRCWTTRTLVGSLIHGRRTGQRRCPRRLLAQFHGLWWCNHLALAAGGPG